MRIQVGALALLTCALLASCAPTDKEPRPSGTLQPRMTESSPMPTADKNNVACTLLTASERAASTGYAMNAELPVRPEPGTEECVWVRSLRQPPRAAIRVVALSTPVWSRQIGPQIRAAITSPNTSTRLAAKLEAALTDMLANPDGLPTERVCETYILLAESRGAKLGVDQVAYMRIGAMPAAFSVSCEDGIMTIAGYGEYGVRPSLALNRVVTRLVEAASGRAAEALENAAIDDDGGDNPSPEGGDSDEEAPTDDAEGTEDAEDAEAQPNPEEEDEDES